MCTVCVCDKPQAVLIEMKKMQCFLFFYFINLAWGNSKFFFFQTKGTLLGSLTFHTCVETAAAVGLILLSEMGRT